MDNKVVKHEVLLWNLNILQWKCLHTYKLLSIIQLMIVSHFKHTVFWLQKMLGLFAKTIIFDANPFNEELIIIVVNPNWHDFMEQKFRFGYGCNGHDSALSARFFLEYLNRCNCKCCIHNFWDLVDSWFFWWKLKNYTKFLAIVSLRISLIYKLNFDLQLENIL